MGIKRKIQLGFLSIGSLLLLSGVILSLELVQFNKSTYSLLESNVVRNELCKEMLDAAQEQNTGLLLNVTDSIHTTHDSQIEINRAKFAAAYSSAKETFPASETLKALDTANAEYSKVISEITDTTSVDWFLRVYQTSYQNFTAAIKNFMVDTENQVLKLTADLEQKAYRATMVGIIALAAGILLLIMFYFMINRFVIGPVIKLQISLDRYLNLRVPFDVQVDTKDEIKRLRDEIKQIIEQAKK